MTPQQLAAHLLADKHRCGLYRIPPGWAGEARAAGLEWKTLAPLPRIDRASLLAALGTALHFPDYYGQNWDAAWDCLTELDWPATQLLAIHLPITTQTKVAEADLQVFLELLGEACQHWAEQGRALCLLVESDRTDLAELNALATLDA